MKLLPGISASIVLALVVFPVRAQVNSGSNGSDGAFHPTTNTVINMADHPDGIYHYTSVNIPAGVTVTFTPNANNTPVVWLVQRDCVINGTIEIVGKPGIGGVGGRGGPGGHRGGNAGNSVSEAGFGPGGGSAYNSTSWPGVSGAGSFGSQGGGTTPGNTYGNKFLLPLLGGSGGGGRYYTFFGEIFCGGGGGGGSFLVASSNVVLVGGINANGGDGVIATTSVDGGRGGSAGGSGGGVRIVANQFSGNGWIHTAGGYSGGLGRIRIDVYDSNFSGSLIGVGSQGFQPIIIPSENQGVQLSVATVGGTSIPSNPSSTLANPAVIIPGQQANPIPIAVRCSNIPLNTPITVTVKPANGPAVSATANNTAGTSASSTATVNINMPRGGGIIYATTVVGIAGQQASLLSAEKTARIASVPERGSPSRNTSDISNASEKSERLVTDEVAAGHRRHRPALRDFPLSVTGWTASGERFAKMEITAALDGKQEITYITESGKRYPMAVK